MQLHVTRLEQQIGQIAFFILYNNEEWWCSIWRYIYKEWFNLTNLGTECVRIERIDKMGRERMRVLVILSFLVFNTLFFFQE
jgi:hypothetical protein